ncbi:hypothetical protein RAS1_00420 [Phycisphaerae bacterium RAS1]|nr:hypothetical protein RAS1_00420 [Phycisphaerae bacterium RAS1]
MSDDFDRPAIALDAATRGASAASSAADVAAGGPEDVWSHVSPRYRVRAFLSLAGTFLLFCGLCVFTHWLHVARPFEFSAESYLEPLRFWGPQTKTLDDFIRYPISVMQTPVHAIVLGLLVASIVAIPISVAILYRFGAALLFAAAVFFFAHLPWMAFTLVGCCVLASVKPFRMPFRFGSGLVGMLPVVMYLYLAARGTPDPSGTYATPEQKLLLAAPWILALLAAALMLGMILLIARAVNYRPGAIAPVMAVMFATPTVLFHAYVGLDELNYRVLEREYGHRSRRFEPVADARVKILDLVQHWMDESSLTPGRSAALSALWSERPDELAALKRRIVAWFVTELLGERRTAHEACRKFIAEYPTSRYVPNALYLEGRLLDTRLDQRKLLSDMARELYTDFPHPQSGAVWSTLLTQFTHSPLAAAAAVRTAQLRLRERDVDGAAAALDRVLLRRAAGPTSQATATDWLHTDAPEASLQFDEEAYRLEARQLRDLIAANHPDERFGPAALADWACLDPHRAGYEIELRRLIEHYVGSRLYDNLLLRWITTQPELAPRAAQLERFLAEHAGADSGVEAAYHLAEIELLVTARTDVAARSRGLQRLRTIVERHADSSWAAAAAELIRRHAPASASAAGDKLP